MEYRIADVRVTPCLHFIISRWQCVLLLHLILLYLHVCHPLYHHYPLSSIGEERTIIILTLGVIYCCDKMPFP